MYEQLLQQVADQQRSYGDSLQPPCDGPGVRRLRRRVAAELRIELPVEFAEFLCLTDGLNWNGLYVYPSTTAALATRPDVVLTGVVESNLDHREVAGLEDVLVLGHDSLDMFVWRPSTAEYQILDLVPCDVMETFASFDGLISEALRRCLT